MLFFLYQFFEKKFAYPSKSRYRLSFFLIIVLNVRNKKWEHRCVNDYDESTKKNVWDILLKNHGLKIMWNHKIDRLMENWLGFENKVLISGVILEMVKSFVFSFMFSTVLINVFFSICTQEMSISKSILLLFVIRFTICSIGSDQKKNWKRP